MKKKALSHQHPTAEDFSPRAVRKAVLSETLQHPLTILPAAGSAVSALFMALINVNPVAFATLLGTLALSAGAWVVNFFFRGDRFAQSYLDKISRKRRLAKREEADQLARQCLAVDFDEGAKQALELKAAFFKLYQNLSHHRQDLNAQRFRVLAEDTYYEGLRLLRAALDTFNVIAGIDADQLISERDAWEAQKRELESETGDDQSRTELIRALTTKIDSHNRRLNLHADRKTLLQRLLAETEVLEAALDAAYLESVDLVGVDVQIGRGDRARELERAVSAARKVEERLRDSRAHPNHEADQVYAEAGKHIRD